MNENTNNPQFIPLVPVVEQISRAEIDMQIATAKKYPRDEAKVANKILSAACRDEDTAAACFYSLPRGGKTIQGESVRLAEICCGAYQNLRVATRVVEVDADSAAPHVTVQSTAHDLENNVLVGIEKRRRITAKKDFKTGGRKAIDEDDINLAANAGAAICFRDAIFKIVPKVLIRPAFEQAKKVAIGDAKSLSDRRIKAVEKFALMGIPQARVLASLGKPTIEQVDLADLEKLIGIFSAIKEGELSIDEAFPEPAAPTKPIFASASPATPPTSDGDLGPQTTPPPPVEQPRRRGPGRPKNPPEQAPAVAPASPSEPSAAPGADATGQTPCEYLEKFMKLSGITFTVFRGWLKQTGKIVNENTFGAFSEIPNEMATEILANQEKLSEFVAIFGKKEAK